MGDDKILLVEDSLSMQMVVQSVLTSLCALTCVTSIADAERELQLNSFSMILLDVELPDGNGFDFCKKLRARPQFEATPIVFLTWKSEVDNRVQGFSLGADDYITKPLEPKEFSARIEAKLKRKPKGQLQTTFRKSSFRVDLTGQRVFLVTSGVPDSELNLTPIEFKLLVHFLRNEGIVISREELLIAVWGDAVHISTHTLDTHISSLRKKISSPIHHLRAVIKKGYCFSISTTPEKA